MSKEHSIITINTIPGDKSISHRAIILGSLAENSVYYKNFLFSEDCLNTSTIFQNLGAKITTNKDTLSVQIEGLGLNGLKQAKNILDVGNSGTGIRLITGVLACQPFSTTITGDSSIQKRPMKRIIDPLSEMGCLITGQEIKSKNDIYPPLKIEALHEKLKAIEYHMPVASAQVKSAILLASLFSREKTTVIEKKPSRNHTEIMLKAFNADIQVNKNKITCSGKHSLIAPESSEQNPLIIPSDFSSAAFFIVLGLISKNTTVVLKNIGINPTRASLIEVLQDMGGKISIEPHKGPNIEPIADIIVQSSKLENITVNPDLIPFIIDEIPVLAIAALFASGTLHITNAEELRVKESDRIETTAAMAQALGGTVETFEDGFTLTGTDRLKNAAISSYGDHRIAMSAFIAAKAAQLSIDVDNTSCINTSFPNFFSILHQF